MVQEITSYLNRLNQTNNKQNGKTKKKTESRHEKQHGNGRTKVRTTYLLNI